METGIRLFIFGFSLMELYFPSLYIFFNRYPYLYTLYKRFFLFSYFYKITVLLEMQRNYVLYYIILPYT